MSDKGDTALKTKEAETLQGPGGDSQQVTVDLSAYLETPDSTSPVMTFAVEEHQRNTADNPNRENTNLVPVLVRRVNSEELLPRPFKSMNQLLCWSYLSMLCCCGFAVYAVEHAWEAKQKRNDGVFTASVKEAKTACLCMKLALGVGLVAWVVGAALLVVYFTKGFNNH